MNRLMDSFISVLMTSVLVSHRHLSACLPTSHSAMKSLGSLRHGLRMSTPPKSE